MIDLYTWRTPNGRKVSIMLEEVGLPYTVHPINIMEDEQFHPTFTEISPNNKIPAIVDSDGPDGTPITLMESGAILIYLAEKTGQLLPTEPFQRYKVLQWLMWQMGGFGPMLGQAHHFRRFTKEKIPYAINRYTTEADRLYAVLDDQLEESPYICNDYSIADIATYPWTVTHEWQGIDLEDFPNVARWMDSMKERPAVERGWNAPPEA